MPRCVWLVHLHTGKFSATWSSVRARFELCIWLGVRLGHRVPDTILGPPIDGFVWSRPPPSGVPETLLGSLHLVTCPSRCPHTSSKAAPQPDTRTLQAAQQWRGSRPPPCTVGLGPEPVPLTTLRSLYMMSQHPACAACEPWV